jgi:O-antigen/teichoic acid export membrane protein
MKAFRIPNLPDRARLMTYAALLAMRGGYILSRLLVTLALPLILSVEALGKFGVFSGLVAAVPIVVAFGLPEHAARRLNRGPNRPVFRALVMQTSLGLLAAFAVSALWLHVYPDLDNRTIAMVAGITALTLLRTTLGMVLLGRGAVVRANLAFALATSGPFFAVVAALILPKGAVDLTTVCLLWLLTSLAAVSISLPAFFRDLSDLRTGHMVRLPLLLVRQFRILIGLRHLHVNQIIDLTRTYLDRIILPLIAGFHLAGIYNVFALATSVAVMVPNSLCGHVDLPRLVMTARNDVAGFKRIVMGGVALAAGIAGLMIAPLFFMEHIVEAVLAVDLDSRLYRTLCVTSMLGAMFAAVAEYLWHATYAARAERQLSRYIVPTIVLSVIFIAGGTAGFGLIGASLAVAVTNACVALLRARALAAHLAGHVRLSPSLASPGVQLSPESP